MVAIATVNAMTDDEFIAAFGTVLEESPHLAALVGAERPFADAEAVSAAFAAVVEGLDDDDAIALLRAHPELGATRPMAAASVAEQASAGLPGAEADLRDRLAAGNAAYRARFGFPFIIAVRGRIPAEIVSELERRLDHDRSTELATARAQVAIIAALRVAQLVDAP